MIRGIRVTEVIKEVLPNYPSYPIPLFSTFILNLLPMRNLYLFLLLFIFAGTTSQAQTTIPVVFHVVYKLAPQNIPDSCLQHQLDVLNEDFNAANPDLWKVPAAWVPIIGNMNVNFVFASTDPNGNPTNGIERFQTTVNSFGTNNAVCYSAQGGLDAWPDTSYLNIWVCNLGNSLLGYAQFPGGNPATSGVVLHYRNVGRGSYCWPPYDKGRTGTHEVAHWFGLRNFYNQPNCSIDGDQIPDTPTYASGVYGSYAPFQVVTDSCNLAAPGVMWMNFMTACSDSSMYFFTQNQTDTMTWVLNNLRTGFITGVKELTGEIHATIFPSPSANGIFTLSRTTANADATIRVCNSLGAIIAPAYRMQPAEKTMQLDLSAFPDGIYFVTIIEQGKQRTSKIIIAR